MLRGLEPGATAEEIEAAARQYVRKVSGVATVSAATAEPFELAVQQVAAITTELLTALPARKQPPPTLPPLRRIKTAKPLETAASPTRSARPSGARDRLVMRTSQPQKRG